MGNPLLVRNREINENANTVRVEINVNLWLRFMATKSIVRIVPPANIIMGRIRNISLSDITL